MVAQPNAKIFLAATCNEIEKSLPSESTHVVRHGDASLQS